MARKRNDIISAVEIGTRNVKVLIAELLEENTLNIIGFGESPSHKVDKGEISNPKIVFRGNEYNCFNWTKGELKKNRRSRI